MDLASKACSSDYYGIPALPEHRSSSQKQRFSIFSVLGLDIIFSKRGLSSLFPFKYNAARFQKEESLIQNP